MSKKNVMTMGGAFALAATALTVSAPRAMAYANFRWAYPASLKTRSNLGINSAFYYWQWGTLLEGFWLEPDWQIHEHKMDFEGMLPDHAFGVTYLWADVNHLCRDTDYNYFTPFLFAGIFIDTSTTFAHYQTKLQVFEYFDTNPYVMNWSHTAGTPNIWMNNYAPWADQNNRHEMGHALGIIYNIYDPTTPECQTYSPDNLGV